MKALIIFGTLLLVPMIALATPDTQPVDTTTLITNIANSNLSESEKAHLIESYIESRTLNTSPVRLKDNNYRHQNPHDSDSHDSHGCNGSRGQR